MPSAGLAPDLTGTRCALAAMGTIITIRASGGSATEGARAAISEVELLEMKWSRFRPDSEVSRLTQAAGDWVAVSAETGRLLRSALTLGEQTCGAFDVTAGSPAGGLLEADDATRFRLLDGARLDLGGIAKGAAAARVLEILQEFGATRAVVNFGQSSIGFLGTPGDRPTWRVGIRRPGSPADGILGALEVAGGFVSTSGDYEASSSGGNHILDPRTGAPASSGVRSATVFCADGARAEALSTALVVLGVDAGLALRDRLGGFEAVLVAANGQVISTPGLSGNG